MVLFTRWGRTVLGKYSPNVAVTEKLLAKKISETYQMGKWKVHRSSGLKYAGMNHAAWYNYLGVLKGRWVIIKNNKKGLFGQKVSFLKKGVFSSKKASFVKKGVFGQKRCRSSKKVSFVNKGVFRQKRCMSSKKCLFQNFKTLSAKLVEKSQV